MIQFPINLLKPIQKYLEERRKDTEKKIADMEKEDPFSDTDRLSDNAATDTDVKEQVGHQRVEAIKMELSRNLVRIKKALSKISRGKYGVCEKCGKMIDTERLAVFPTADLCIDCAKKEEKKKA